MQPVRSVPLVPQRLVSIIAVSGAPLEAVALRAVLESFNYRVETHWIGSWRQFLGVMSGSVPTFDLVVVCCHGTDGGIVMDTMDGPRIPHVLRSSSTGGTPAE